MTGGTRLLLCIIFFLVSAGAGTLALGKVEDAEVFQRSQFKNFGPGVKASVGQPWPKPQLMKHYGEGFMIVRPALFRFEVVRHSCDILEDALKRYYNILFNSNLLNKINQRMIDGDIPSGNKTWKLDKDFNGYLDTLRIDLLKPCENMPHDEMKEAYELKVDTPDLVGKGFLASPTIWGILRGLETFVQLVHHSDDFTSLQIKNVFIMDYPRFPFRGILLDTSRHFLSKKILFQNLDLMAMNKYNVFHWHIVDDQSFPYQSKGFPALSNKGSYHAYTHVYTQEDVKDVIEYARLRGIRVVAEFDTPGHTRSWGPGMPDFLTKCCDARGNPDGTFGPVDVSNPANFEFLKSFFEEVATVFPDKYLHLGGDEVEHQCWKSNPNITDFIEQMNFTDYSQLEGYYMQNLIDIVKTFPQNNSYLVWQEVFDRGVELQDDTIVHIWKGENLTDEIFNVTAAGYRSLVYSCWYLNYISYGIDWHKHYLCDPHNFNGTDAQKRLVFGGGAAMWAEFVDSTNIIPRLWPRAAVPAERLWSHQDVVDLQDAEKRIEEHRCRLLQRGFNVEPMNGPGYCLVE